MSKRVLLSVDVSNLYYCVNKRFDGKLDYTKLLDFARTHGDLYRSIAYGAQMHNEAHRFCNFLEMHGFEVRYKRPKTVGPNAIRKADWDVGMVLDVVRILPSVDIVVLASADGDMAPLIDYIHEQGKLCHIIGCNISFQLREKADRVHEITKDMLDYEPTNDPRRSLPSQLICDGDGTQARGSD